MMNTLILKGQGQIEFLRRSCRPAAGPLRAYCAPWAWSRASPWASLDSAFLACDLAFTSAMKACPRATPPLPRPLTRAERPAPILAMASMGPRDRPLICARACGVRRGYSGEMAADPSRCPLWDASAMAVQAPCLGRPSEPPRADHDHDCSCSCACAPVPHRPQLCAWALRDDTPRCSK